MFSERAPQASPVLPVVLDRPVCELHDVAKSYRGRADVLRGVHLRIARRELLAVTGPSGSGKTSLLNILGLLDRPCAGEYVLDGEPTGALGTRARAELRQRKLAFVFQAFHLLDSMSALDNAALPLVYRNIGWAAARHRAAECLEQLGLGGKANDLPHRLSAGQQQRVGLARAMVSQPTLLLADEPTGNLDAQAAASVLALFDRLRQDHDVAIVLVTHDPNVATRCDRVLQVRAGTVETGDTGDA